MKNTDEVKKIWEENDRARYREETFGIIRSLLEERGIYPPPQKKSTELGDTATANETKFIVLPKNQFWTMAFISVIIGYALLPHGEVSGAVGLSIVVIAFACLVAMVPAGIYWIAKRKRMPGLTVLIWIAWAVVYGFLALGIIMRIA
ncbi:MAG: hypothetical protein V3W31_05865 [Thermodesulfobacteriota bacterium]